LGYVLYNYHKAFEKIFSHPIAIFGLGKSGFTAALALLKANYRIHAWDDDVTARKKAQDAGILLIDLYSAHLADYCFVIWSPGIAWYAPLPHPIAIKAKAASVPLLSDVHVFFMLYQPKNTIGISGTNGKSSCTALLAYLLDHPNQPTYPKGNFGNPIFEDEFSPHHRYVVEMSSYQLELGPALDFELTLLTAITPDHLDRHKGFLGYCDAKNRLIEGQDPNHFSVISLDSPASKAIYDRHKTRFSKGCCIPISTQNSLENLPNGVWVEEGYLYQTHNHARHRKTSLTDIQALQGVHNHENAALCYAGAIALGQDTNEMMHRLHGFKGLAHRQEYIATMGLVRYINDSKATNLDATAKALACFDTIFWIAGGVAKSNTLDALELYFHNIQHVFLIGQASTLFAQCLDQKLPYTQCTSLIEATHLAHEMAQSSGKKATVLLSPACASWDQFPNFEVRGKTFCDYIKQLI
jgi:UDP-N-acetylmuramoylalanine--D-glutamate ligase